MKLDIEIIYHISVITLSFLLYIMLVKLDKSNLKYS